MPQAAVEGEGDALEAGADQVAGAGAQLEALQGTAHGTAAFERKCRRRGWERARTRAHPGAVVGSRDQLADVDPGASTSRSHVSVVPLLKVESALTYRPGTAWRKT